MEKVNYNKLNKLSGDDLRLEIAKPFLSAEINSIGIFFLSIFSPSLSCGPNILYSLPNLEYKNWPVVITPSTSNTNVIFFNLFNTPTYPTR